MDTTKFLLATLVGGVTMFLLGWIVYGLTFAGFFESQAVLSADIMSQVSKQDNVTYWSLFLGSCASASVYAYVFEKWAGIRTFQTGAKSGAILGFLITLGINLSMHGTMNLMTVTGHLVDSIIWIALGAIVGGVVGWVLGMGRDPA